MAKLDRWQELCAKAAVEQDLKRLLEVVTEINQILEQKEKDRTERIGGKMQ